MSKRKLAIGVILDVVLLGFWMVILLIELLFTNDIILIIVAFVCVFVFSALLGRDVRRARRAAE